MPPLLLRLLQYLLLLGLGLGPCLLQDALRLRLSLGAQLFRLRP